MICCAGVTLAAEGLDAPAGGGDGDGEATVMATVPTPTGGGLLLQSARLCPCSLASAIDPATNP